MRLTFPSDSVVVVAGVPGAGKTTLMRRAVDRTAVRVIDTEDRREQGARGAARLYGGHYLRIGRAIAGRRPTVIHSRGTHPAARRLILLLATLRRRSAHLVLLDADPAGAVAGQRARGRVIAEPEMRRQVARWRRIVQRTRDDGALRGEPWRSITLLDRPGAARIEAFEFPRLSRAVPRAPRARRFAARIARPRGA